MGQYRPRLSLQEKHRRNTTYLGGKYNQCEGIQDLGRCISNVNENQSSFSNRTFNKILCWSC